MAAPLPALAFGPAGARAQTATEAFAFNVIYKNYAIGEHVQTTILDDSFRAKCRRVKKARKPTAWCWLSWNSDHAHWTACVDDGCSAVDPKHRVKRRVWKGRGTNAPA